MIEPMGTSVHQHVCCVFTCLNPAIEQIDGEWFCDLHAAQKYEHVAETPDFCDFEDCDQRGTSNWHGYLEAGIWREV